MLCMKLVRSSCRQGLRSKVSHACQYLRSMRVSTGLRRLLYHERGCANSTIVTEWWTGLARALATNQYTLIYKMHAYCLLCYTNCVAIKPSAIGNGGHWSAEPRPEWTHNLTVSSHVD